MVLSERPQEGMMVPSVISWLRRTGRVRPDSLVALELPWLGRRVDIAIMTKSGRLLAFELKLDNNRRAIEQAARNSLTFDRSYIVTASNPSSELELLARELGVGVVVMNGTDMVLSAAPILSGSRLESVRRRLQTLLLSRGIPVGHV